MINQYKQQGFTLIELMITLAILAILTSIAVPSYMSYVYKSKRTEGKTELLRIAQLQESYYIQNLSYAAALTDLGFAAASQDTEGGLYTITTKGTTSAEEDCDGTNAKPCTGYAVLAVPVAGEGQDKDPKCAGGGW